MALKIPASVLELARLLGSRGRLVGAAWLTCAALCVGTAKAEVVFDGCSHLENVVTNVGERVYNIRDVVSVTVQGYRLQGALRARVTTALEVVVIFTGAVHSTCQIVDDSAVEDLPPRYANKAHRSVEADRWRTAATTLSVAADTTGCLVTATCGEALLTTSALEASRLASSDRGQFVLNVFAGSAAWFTYAVAFAGTAGASSLPASFLAYSGLAYFTAASFNVNAYSNQVLANDPPDPNYTPLFAYMPISFETPIAGLPATLDQQVREFLRNLAYMNQASAGVLTSVERLQGAIAGGSEASIIAQVDALTRFGADEIKYRRDARSSLAALLPALAAQGICDGGAGDVSLAAALDALGGTTDSAPRGGVGPAGCVVQSVDDDRDGVANSADACPGTVPRSAVNSAGCSSVQLDSDRDGVPDGADVCPATPLGTAVDSRGCPLPPPDADSDGVADSTDQCPSTPAGSMVDGNGCSAAQRDTDGDGVADSSDVCPGTAAGVAVDARGCPIPPVSTLACDLNLDRFVDYRDILGIVKARGQSALGSTDARDPNRDGLIDLRDAAICTAKCSRLLCLPPR